MTELAFLPPEVLGLVLFGKANSFLVLRLWKCGNISLNQKLATGVEYIHLKDERLDTTSRYPKLLSDLRALRYLSLSRGLWPLMGSPMELSAQLQALNGLKLETLRIKSADASKGLFLYNSSLFGTRPTQSVYQLGSSRLFDMSGRFPRLLRLKIDSSENSSTISETDFAGLPSTLTELTLPLLNTPDLLLNVCATLPRSLQRWKTEVRISGFSVLSAPFWQDAPPDLHTLSKLVVWSLVKHQGPNQPIESPNLANIPRSITDCEILIGGGSSLPLQSLQTLPPSSLRLNNSPMDLASMGPSNDYRAWKIPSQITELCIRNSGLSKTIPPQLMPTLPATLLKLEFSALQYDNDDWTNMEKAIQKAAICDVFFWPRHLNHLVLDTRFVPQSIYALLPRSLTYLSLPLESGDFHPEDLPSGLQTLRIHNVRLLEPLYIRSGLSPSLLSLEVACLNRVIRSESLLALPPTIRSLNLLSCRFSHEWSSAIRFDNMRVFKVLEWRPSWFHLLPRNLTHFQTEQLSFIPQERSSKFYYELPSSLEYLSVGDNHGHKEAEEFKVVGDEFAHLTRLNHLTFSPPVIFPCSVLSHLPDCLRRLTITLADFKIPALPFLNPRWTQATIILRNSKDANRLFRHWPVNVNPGGSWLSQKGDLEERVKQAQANVTLCPHPQISNPSTHTRPMSTWSRMTNAAQSLWNGS